MCSTLAVPEMCEMQKGLYVGLTHLVSAKFLGVVLGAFICLALAGACCSLWFKMIKLKIHSEYKIINGKVEVCFYFVIYHFKLRFSRLECV